MTLDHAFAIAADPTTNTLQFADAFEVIEHAGYCGICADAQYGAVRVPTGSAERCERCEARMRKAILG